MSSDARRVAWLGSSRAATVVPCSLASCAKACDNASWGGVGGSETLGRRHAAAAAAAYDVDDVMVRN